MRYLLVPPNTICLVTDICAYSSKPMGLFFLSLLSNTMVTLAFVTPACPRLYIRSYGFFRIAIWCMETAMAYLQVLSADGAHIRDTQDETYRI